MPRPCLWLTSVTGQSVSQSFLKAVAQAITLSGHRFSGVTQWGARFNGDRQETNLLWKGPRKVLWEPQAVVFHRTFQVKLWASSRFRTIFRTTNIGFFMHLCSGMMLRPAQCWSFSIILVFVLELCLRMLAPKYGWPVSCSSWLDRSIRYWPYWVCLTSHWRFMKIAGPNVHTLRHWLRSGAQRHGDLWETELRVLISLASYKLLLRACPHVVCWIHFWLKLYRKGFNAVIFDMWTCLLYLLKDTKDTHTHTQLGWPKLHKTKPCDKVKVCILHMHKRHRIKVFGIFKPYLTTP